MNSENTQLTKVIEYITKNQWSWFNQSLLTQYNTKGYLTPRQVEAVVRHIELQEAKRTPVESFTLKPGDRLQVKRWIADRAKNDLNLPVFFRNLEVVEVLRETYKAYQVKVKFISTICFSCHFCGKPLDTEVSRAIGVGPVCCERNGLGRPTLETAKDALAALDKLAHTVGVVGPFWLPKSQVVKGE